MKNAPKVVGIVALAVAAVVGFSVAPSAKAAPIACCTDKGPPPKP